LLGPARTTTRSEHRDESNRAEEAGCSHRWSLDGRRETASIPAERLRQPRARCGGSHPRRPPAGSVTGYLLLTDCLRPERAENLGTVASLIHTFSPVRGFTP